MIPVTYIPRKKLVFRQKNGVISCTLETRPGINLSASKTITIVTQDTVYDLFLEVEFDGQTQFNVFGNAAHHALLVNGIEYHSYVLQQVLGNWRLLWAGNFPLQTSDELIFRTFNT